MLRRSSRPWGRADATKPAQVKKRARKLVQHPRKGIGSHRGQRAFGDTTWAGRSAPPQAQSSWSIYLAYLLGLSTWPIYLAYLLGLSTWPIELAEGIEPTTARLQGGCSTN